MSSLRDNGSKEILVAAGRAVLENENKNAAIGVKASAGRRPRLGERIRRRDVIALNHKSRARQRSIHIFALAIDRRIDLVRDAVVALVALKAGVVGCRHAP